jgi:AcrR family transcriptional regulator
MLESHRQPVTTAIRIDMSARTRTKSKKATRPATTGRRRLTPAARNEQILSAARELILQQGSLPLSLEQLAEKAGTSKALIYAYFPSHYELYNALMRAEVLELEAAGMHAASLKKNLREAAVSCAKIYFEHVAKRGPVLHLILRDLYMARHIDPQVARFRDTIVRRLARQVRRKLNLPARENIASINMAITIPEEAGRLAFQNELSPSRAWLVCEELLSSSIEALSPHRARREASGSGSFAL